MNKTFDYASRQYNPQSGYYSSGDEIRIKKVLSLIGQHKRVLDLGCYDGTIGERIIKQGNQVWGLEASSEAVNQAKKRKLKAVVGDVSQKLPFKNNFFNVVFAGEILEHLVDTDSFIEEVKRVLKPGGELVLTTPNVASLGRRLLLVFGRNPYFEASLGFPLNQSSGHVRFYTKNLLQSFLDYKGFEIVSFTSDIVNLSNSLYLQNLANIFPTLGRTLIVKGYLIKGSK